MKPKMILEKGTICKKWIDCPLYSKCLNKSARNPQMPLNWTCEECPYLKFATANQIVVFRAGYHPFLSLKELWEEEEEEEY